VSDAGSERPSGLLARLLPLLLLALGTVGCDQVTKEVAIRTLRGAAPMSWLADTVRIQYAENPGAFLGMGNALSEDTRFWLLIVGNGALLLGVLVWMLVAAGRERWVAVGGSAPSAPGSSTSRTSRSCSGSRC
jgi:signal peptidase II